MTDDEADDLDRRYYRHQDSGQHGEQEEPETPPHWLGLIFLGLAVAGVGGLVWAGLEIGRALWWWS